MVMLNCIINVNLTHNHITERGFKNNEKKDAI